jgi:proteasome lid subunit RPN8/RPN11
MLADVRSVYPLEACGLMAGKAGIIQHIYPVKNILSSHVAYQMDPTQQVNAMLELEERGWELLAIYHSHPLGPPTPSPSDIAQATYPEAAYVIISMRDTQSPSIRAFKIEEASVSEIRLEIE